MSQVKDLMSCEVVTVQESETIRDVLGAFEDRELSSLPVVSEPGRCIGMVSMVDLLGLTRDLDKDMSDLEKSNRFIRAFNPDCLHNMGAESVKKVMTENATHVSPNTSAAEAASLMLRHQVHHLPVVDDDGHVVGIISSMDLLHIVAEMESH